MNKYIFDEEYESSIWTSIFGLVMGIFIICLIIWNRLLRERLPHEIVPAEAFTLSVFFTTIIFLYFFVITGLYLNILRRQIFKIETESYITIWFYTFLRQNPRLLNVLGFLQCYILRSPIFLWRYLYFNVSDKYKIPVKRILYKIAIFIFEKFFPANTNVYQRQFLATLFLYYLPRISIFSIFSYEILFKNKIEIFYYFTPFLLIPAIFVTLRRILLEFSYFEKEHLSKFYVKVLSRSGYDWDVTKLNPDMPDDEYWPALDNFAHFTEVIDVMTGLFQIGEKYDFYFDLIFYLILTFGFFIWVLILFDVI